jgi:hypothetical protein
MREGKMNLKPAILPNIISKWAVFGLIPIVLVLTAIIFNVVSSFFLTYEQLSNQSMASGNVKVTNGSFVNQSRSSHLIPQYENTQSGKGPEIASFKLLDGSFLFVCVSNQTLPHSFDSIRKQSLTGPSACLSDSFDEWRQRIFLADR